MSIFTQIKSNKPKRTAFNLSHNYKMTGRMGLLYPILCQDVLPGDTFKLSTEIFMRMQPLIAPMMSRVRIYTHYFFVPKRLLWSGWREFITGASQSKSRKDIENFVPPEYPRFVFETSQVDGVNFPNPPNKYRIPFTEGTLADYLGFPVYDLKDQDGRQTATSLNVVDALPIRAYNLIWNEYYRDENLQDEVDIFFDKSGIVDFTKSGDPILPFITSSDFFNLKHRAWKKDYFTSALPFAQAGPDVELPLTNMMGDDFTLPVETIFSNSAYYKQKIYNHEADQETASFGLSSGSGNLINPNQTGGIQDILLDVPRGTADGESIYRVPNSSLKELTSQIGSATINELRRAFAAQRFLEANARGGSRYIEQLYSIFGVKSSDARLQRPEYLGGGVQDVVVSDVLQTSASDQTSPQANQAGIGASLGRSGGFKRFFEEHGYVIGIMSVLPEASYQQGMPRQYMKFDRFDHYWPQFAHLGEQEIKNSEIFYNGTGDSTDFEGEGTFGYTPRYAEYKFIPSTVHGDFRTNLNFWHLGRIFNERPNLNSTFISADPRSDIFAVDQDVSDPLLFNIQHHFKAVRPMPRFGTPH